MKYAEKSDTWTTTTSNGWFHDYFLTATSFRPWPHDRRISSLFSLLIWCHLSLGIVKTHAAICFFALLFILNKSLGTSKGFFEGNLLCQNICHMTDMTFAELPQQVWERGGAFNDLILHQLKLILLRFFNLHGQCKNILNTLSLVSLNDEHQSNCNVCAVPICCCCCASSWHLLCLVTSRESFSIIIIIIIIIVVKNKLVIMNGVNVVNVVVVVVAVVVVVVLGVVDNVD